MLPVRDVTIAQRVSRAPSNACRFLGTVTLKVALGNHATTEEAEAANTALVRILVGLRAVLKTRDTSPEAFAILESLDGWETP